MSCLDGVIRDASVRFLTSFGMTGAVRRWALGVERLVLRQKERPGSTNSIQAFAKNYPADAV
jgi:hypothetical protein